MNSHSSSSPGSTCDVESEEQNNPFALSSEEGPHRRSRIGRRHQANLNDIIVEVLEFEVKLGLDEFLESLHTAVRVFDSKQILEDKKVKLLALIDLENIPFFGGLICVPKELEKEMPKSELGRK